jgi:RNA polymerase sigma-70 factor (ECF subfamily)
MGGVPPPEAPEISDDARREDRAEAARLLSAFGDAASRPQAAAAMFRRYAPMVLRILRRSLGPRSDAADLAQEVFLRVFARVGTLDSPESLRSFVFGITLNVLKWEARRQKVRRLVHLTPTPRVWDVEEPEAMLEARQSIRRFEEILARLAGHHRALFVLKYVERLTIPELVTVTGKSPATLKRRLREARASVERGVAADPGLALQLGFRGLEE